MVADHQNGVADRIHHIVDHLDRRYGDLLLISVSLYATDLKCHRSFFDASEGRVLPTRRLTSFLVHVENSGILETGCTCTFSRPSS